MYFSHDERRNCEKDFNVDDAGQDLYFHGKVSSFPYDLFYHQIKAIREMRRAALSYRKCHTQWRIKLMYFNHSA